MMAIFDLLVGEIRGSLFMIPNLGDLKFGQPEKLTISAAGDAGPICKDWDNDGKIRYHRRRWTAGQ